MNNFGQWRVPSNDLLSFLFLLSHQLFCSQLFIWNAYGEINIKRAFFAEYIPIMKITERLLLCPSFWCDISRTWERRKGLESEEKRIRKYFSNTSIGCSSNVFEFLTPPNRRYMITKIWSHSCMRKGTKPRFAKHENVIYVLNKMCSTWTKRQELKSEVQCNIYGAY